MSKLILSSHVPAHSRTNAPKGRDDVKTQVSEALNDAQNLVFNDI